MASGGRLDEGLATLAQLAVRLVQDLLHDVVSDGRRRSGRTTLTTARTVKTPMATSPRLPGQVGVLSSPSRHRGAG